MSVDLSSQAIEQVRALAVSAAQDDNWMEPLFDDIKTSSFSEFEEENRRMWEETEHFDTYYGRKISEIADREEALTIGKLSTESRLYDIYLPLLDLFWETYTDVVDLYSKWKMVKRRHKIHRIISPHGMCVEHCVEHELDPEVKPCR